MSSKLITATCAALLLSAPLARANGRLPEANQLVVAPDDDQQLLLRVTFGLLFSSNGGKSWDWMCEHATVPQTETSTGGFGSQDPAVTLFAGGTTAAGIIQGLALSSDRGCAWSFWPGTEKVFVVDVARGAGGQSGVAITNVYKGADDAGTLLYDTTVLHTSDSGKSWQQLPGAIDPSLVIDTIDLAASDPQRIYITGKRFLAQTQAELLVSSDGGQSYQSLSIPLLPNETGAYIAAVDPLVADRVYVRTLGSPDGGATKTSRLLVTTDAGQSFGERWSGDAMLGFALSPDGSRVWLGSFGAGLLAADATTLAFTQQSTIHVQCLMASGSTLYACSNEPSAGFLVGSSTDDGKTFTPLLKLATIQQPIQCSSGTAGAVCASEWPALAQQFGIDAGTTPPPSSGCSCDATDSSPSAWWLALGIAALGLRLRSRPSRGAR